jgi:hypothetical protein
MANWNWARFMGAISLILAAVLINGCAGGGQTLVETGGQALPQEVTTEYLLTTAGFKRLPVNDDTPKRQALMNSIPSGKLVTYTRNGEVYHAYADEGSKALYLGDEPAYQRYLALARGRKLCERVPGTNQVEFWGCMQEYQGRGTGR